MNPIKVNRRHIILASILLALATAVGINYWISPVKQMKNEIMASYSSDEPYLENENNEHSEISENNEQKGIKNTKDIEKIKQFFENERNQKEKARKQIYEIASSDQDYVKKIAQEIRQENNIETLIRSKNDDNLIDCIARIGKNGCNVIVSFKTDLTKENVYKIKDIIKSQTDFKNEEIIISEKKI